MIDNNIMDSMIYHIYWGTSGNSGLYLDEIYQCLKNAGFNQRIFVSYYYPFDYGDKIFFHHSDMAHCKVNGIRRKILQLFEIMIAFVKISIAAKKESPTIVNYSLVGGSYFFVVWFLELLKKVSGCKIVITCHDVCPWGVHEKESSEMINRQKIFDIADFLLVHNKNSIADLHRVFHVERKKIVKHLFPIMDLTKLRKVGPVEKKCDFLFIGHLRKDKGVDFLVNSWSKFHQQNEKATLWLCGRPQGQKFDVELLKAQNVTCNLGYISEEDYCRYIQSARYVVLPYLKGTNSGIISTVLSLGANVITSDIPMFQDNPLVDKDCMFKVGDQQSCINLFQAKYKTHEDKEIMIALKKYRNQFEDEVIEAYKTIIKAN